MGGSDSLMTAIDQSELRYFPSALRDFSELPNLEQEIVTEQHFETVPSLVYYYDNGQEKKFVIFMHILSVTCFRLS